MPGQYAKVRCLVGRLLAVAVTVWAIAAATPGTGWGQQPSAAPPLTPAEVGLKLRLLPATGLGVVGEPLVAVLSLTNASREDRSLVQPKAGVVHLTVRATRQPVPAPPQQIPSHAQSGDCLVERLAGGASRSFLLLADPAHQIEQAELYEIKAEVWDWSSISLLDDAQRADAHSVPLLGTVVGTYQPRPGTAAELDGVCATLTWWLTGLWREDTDRSAWPELWRDETLQPQARRLTRRLLAAVRAEQVVPYLTQWALSEQDPQAFEALAATGLPAGRAVLERLAGSRIEAVASAARAALGR